MSTWSAVVSRDSDGQVTLRCPGVGIWQGGPVVAQVVVPGQVLGTLEVLGRRHTLVVPDGEGGVIERCPAGAGEVAVAYGDALVVLGDFLAVPAADGNDSETLVRDGDGALVFRSSASGRFYLRPAPDKPAFVAVGDSVEEGQTVFLLEVMKTFSRVAYGGAGLPEHANILRIFPADGDDIEAGDPVLELEIEARKL